MEHPLTHTRRLRVSWRLLVVATVASRRALLSLRKRPLGRAGSRGHLGHTLLFFLFGSTRSLIPGVPFDGDG